MIQFYFLSVLLNALAGFILFTWDEEGVLEFKSNFSLKDETFKLVIGILSMVTGLLKLLSPIVGDLLILGDLVPGAAGLMTGFILIFEYYRNRSSLETTEHTERIDRILMNNKKIIGLAAMIIALLHFLFPKVLLL